MKILALCGSLRPYSANSHLLVAARNEFESGSAAKSEPVEWREFNLSRLPYFDPAAQFSNVPAVVEDLRRMGAESDLIFISTPEYAHGVPGILKNALEWLFYEGTQKKRVALVIAGTEGQYARDQLLEILPTMDFVVGPDDVMVVRGARTRLGAEGFVSDADRVAFAEFCGRFKQTPQA